MTQPNAQGVRNNQLLRLARGLKFNARMAGAKIADLKPFVKRWHAQALAVIGTKEFDETWSDFIRAWKVASLPLGFDAVAFAATRAKAERPPDAACAYDSDAVRFLVAICWQLALGDPTRRFFLSCRRAGAALAVSHERAMASLNMLVADGVLVLLKHGNQRQAHRYRWIGATEKPKGIKLTGIVAAW
jgi:hypothetical protein